MSNRSWYAGRALFESIRALYRRPLFAALSIGLLALGVGAITAIFAVVNATLLRPLPYREPAALYALDAREPVDGDSSIQLPLSPLQLMRWRSDARAFTGIEGYTPATMKLTGIGDPEPLDGAYVSAGLFALLGVQPAMGRAFARSEEVSGSAVVIISHGMWIRRFGGDPHVIGRVIRINDEPRAVVGIMPEGFSLLFQKMDVWTPVTLGPEQAASTLRMLAAIGRVRPGISSAQARADLVSVNVQLGREQPDEYRLNDPEVVPLRESLFGSQRASLLVLLVAVALLLGIATVNVLSLALADSIARETLTMTRLAFGATPSSIRRMRLVEVGCIGGVAAVLGLIAGRVELGALQAVSPDALAGVGAITFDPIVIAVGFAVALLAAIAAGLPAAMRDARLGVSGLAGTMMKSIGGRFDRRTTDALLTAQIALASVLLVGATLLARNVRSLLLQPSGFSSEGVLVAEMTLSHAKYTTMEERAGYIERLLSAIRPLPGVSAVASIQTRFVLNETWLTRFAIEDRPEGAGVKQLANIRHSTSDVLRVLGIRVRRGRAISEDDRIDRPLVAMVSESFARRYLSGMDPIGHRIRRITMPERPWMEIVGVVDDIRDAGVGVEVGPTIWVSYLQQNTPTARTTLVMRVRGTPAAYAATLRHAIWSVDPGQTIDAISSLDELMLRSAAQPRFEALVTLMLAGAALVLVLSGIYAVTIYSVLRRTREIGVRAAIGASPSVLVSSTMRHSMIPVATGILIGVAIAFPTLRVMQHALGADISVGAVPLFFGVAIALLVGALISSYLPARRVLAISPRIAMENA